MNHFSTVEGEITVQPPAVEATAGETWRRTRYPPCTNSIPSMLASQPRKTNVGWFSSHLLALIRSTGTKAVRLRPAAMQFWRVSSSPPKPAAGTTRNPVGFGRVDLISGARAITSFGCALGSCAFARPFVRPEAWLARSASPIARTPTTGRARADARTAVECRIGRLPIELLNLGLEG
jgi:hypothetical protein